LHSIIMKKLNCNIMKIYLYLYGFLTFTRFYVSSCSRIFWNHLDRCGYVCYHIRIDDGLIVSDYETSRFFHGKCIRKFGSHIWHNSHETFWQSNTITVVSSLYVLRYKERSFFPSSGYIYSLRL
jgi:hypothetical protein